MHKKTVIKLKYLYKLYKHLINKLYSFNLFIFSNDLYVIYLAFKLFFLNMFYDLIYYKHIHSNRIIRTKKFF